MRCLIKILFFATLVIWGQNIGLAKKTSLKNSWEFESKERTVVIGDIHGDPKALLDILVGQKILNKNGNMIDKNFHLVILGDMAGKGPDTKGVWDIIYGLNKMAKKNNAMIHTLFGNHDLMLISGVTSSLSQSDIKKFKSIGPNIDKSIQKTIVSEPYASMMREWKTIIKIGDNIFTHGGIEDYIYKFGPEDINKTVQKFVMKRQRDIKLGLKSGNKIEKNLKEFTKLWKELSGVTVLKMPLWTRKISHQKISSEKLYEMLEFLNAKRLFLGHTPTKDGVITKLYGKMVFLLDTNISSGVKGGKLSSISIDKNNKVNVKNKMLSGEFKKIFYTKFHNDFYSCKGKLRMFLKNN